MPLLYFTACAVPRQIHVLLVVCRRREKTWQQTTLVESQRAAQTTNNVNYTSSHTADDFATFCDGKVDKIRQATSSVPPPAIQTRHVAQFSHFSPVTSTEITDLLAVVPSKCCSLDPLPTWIIKKTETCLCTHSLLTVQFLSVERRHASQSEARDRLTTTEETRLGPNQPQFLPAHF